MSQKRGSKRETQLYGKSGFTSPSFQNIDCPQKWMGAEEDSICEEPGPALALEPGKEEEDGPPPVAALMASKSSTG